MYAPVRRCHGNDMTDACVLKALKSRTRSLNLDNGQLRTITPTIGRLEFLVSFSAKNNQLQTLPTDFAALTCVSAEQLSVLCIRVHNMLYERAELYLHNSQLTYINLGGNQLTAVPDCLLTLAGLQTLHLFKNRIASLPDKLPSSCSHQFVPMQCFMTHFVFI